MYGKLFMIELTGRDPSTEHATVSYTRAMRALYLRTAEKSSSLQRGQRGISPMDVVFHLILPLKSNQEIRERLIGSGTLRRRYCCTYLSRDLACHNGTILLPMLDVQCR